MVLIIGLVAVIAGLALRAPELWVSGFVAIAIGLIVFALESMDSGTRTHYW